MPSESQEPSLPSQPPAGTGTRSRSRRWQPPTLDLMRTLFPRYEILALAGQGGMGAVYQARDSNLERVVAIKVLPLELMDEDLDFGARFQQEARTLAGMKHPGIVRVIDFGVVGGLLHMVMQFVEGIDVSEMLRDHQPLSVQRTLSIMVQLCEALGHAHEHGVVHRDIKPSNVMVGADGQALLMDFGLAKRVAGQNLALTRQSVVMGTPDYLAPEALLMGHVPDARTDIFALGVMLYQMLTGHVPRGKHRPPSERVPGVDRRLDAVVDSCMAENPEARYQNTGELRLALQKIIESPNAVPDAQPSADERTPPAGTKAARSRGRARTRPRRMLVLVGGLAMAAMGLAAMAIFINQRDDGPRDESAPANTAASTTAAPTPPQPPPPATSPQPPTAPPPASNAKLETEKAPLKETLLSFAKAIPSILKPDEGPAPAPSPGSQPMEEPQLPAPPAPVDPSANDKTSEFLKVPHRPAMTGTLKRWRMDGWPAPPMESGGLTPGSFNDVVEIAVNGGPFFGGFRPDRQRIVRQHKRIITALKSDGSVICFSEVKRLASELQRTVEHPFGSAEVKDIVKLCGNGQSRAWQFFLHGSGKLTCWSPEPGLANGVAALNAMAAGLRIVDAHPVAEGVLVLTTEGGVRPLLASQEPGPVGTVPEAATRNVVALAADQDEAAAALQDGSILLWGREGRAHYVGEPTAPFKPVRLKIVASMGLLIQGANGESALLPARGFSWHGGWDPKATGIGSFHFEPFVTNNRGFDHFSSRSFLQKGTDYRIDCANDMILWGSSQVQGTTPWRSVPDSGYCEKMAKGCLQIAFTNGYVVGLRPQAEPASLAGPSAEPAESKLAEDLLLEKLWTDVQGRNVYARFGGVEGDLVGLIINGDRRSVPFATLSHASQQLALRLQGVSGRSKRVLGLIPLSQAQQTSLGSLFLEPYTLRSQPEARKDVIQRMGADPAQIEEAVTRSLDWLKGQQNLDGTWGSKGGADQTGMVLQCFLARGESLESPDTANRLLKAVGYLLEAQDKFSNKMFSRDPADHAAAVCALGELYLLAAANGKTVPGVREAIESGVQAVISGQHHSGGWYFDPVIVGFQRLEGRPDSVSSIGNGHALCMARDCGVRLGGFGQMVTKFTAYLDKARGWNPRGASFVCLRHISGPNAPPPKNGLAAELLEGLHYTLKRNPPDLAKDSLSDWRGNTEALYLSAPWDGGQAWKDYVALAFPQVLAAQQPDGSFRAGDAGTGGDPILRQALCTLMLEVFYRFPSVR